MPYSFDYNTIVATNNPRGRIEPCIVSGTPKPGVVMQLVAATEPVNGVFTYRVYTGTDGNRTTIAVLMEDHLQGKGITDAFVTGTLGELYFPQAGDYLLMQLQDVAGTGDTRAIADKYIVDSTTGQLLVTTGSPQSEPFVLLETFAAPTADVWGLVMYTGY